MPTDPREDTTGDARARAEGRREGWRAAVERAAALLDDWPIYIADTTAPGIMQRDARIAREIRALAEEAPDDPAALRARAEARG